MNKELLEEVRALKLQGVSDQDITDQLKAKYPEASIKECLTALANMRPAAQQIHNPNPIKPTKRKSNKVVTTLIIILTILAILGIYTIGLRQLTLRRIDQLNATLSEKYNVKTSYKAGSATDCTKQKPTRFGDITTTYVCTIIVARIYYPKIQIRTQESTNFSSGKPVKETTERIEYVDSNGSSLSGLNGYIQFGTPTGSSNYRNPQDIEAKLKLKGFDHVVFSGFDGYKSQPSPSYDGWGWSSNPRWLGSDTPGSKLQVEITEKILANTSPVKNAPTISQAMSESRAPLVVFYSLRYCHSPSIPLLDQFCLLPN